MELSIQGNQSANRPNRCKNEMTLSPLTKATMDRLAHEQPNESQMFVALNKNDPNTPCLLVDGDDAANKARPRQVESLKPLANPTSSSACLESLEDEKNARDMPGRRRERKPDWSNPMQV